VIFAEKPVAALSSRLRSRTENNCCKMLG